jgi:predicted MFS family arabinose efflux permease
MAMPDIAAPGRIQGSRLIFSLALAMFGTSMLDVLASLFLIDLAKTFMGSSDNVYLAIVSQIVTISSIAAVVFGILNGFLSVRVNHKKLLLFGALCIAVGTVGCLLAPNLLFLQIFYPFDGVGTIIVGAMAFTLIGESLPLEKRAKSIGIVTSSAILSSSIGFALAGYFAIAGGWRNYLAWYVLPISIIAVLLVVLLIPNAPFASAKNKKSFSNSFREVLANKSAIACLIGNTFLYAGAVWSFFAASFWRKQYGLDVQTVALITVAVTLVYSLGSFIGGRFIHQVGRKRFVTITWFSRGLLIMAIVLMPNMYLALVTSFIATLVGGFALTGGHSLFVEQAPSARGTMMSLGGVFGSIGVSLGVAFGGLALTFGFQPLGLTLGILTLISATIILILAKDPCLMPNKSGKLS